MRYLKARTEGIPDVEATIIFIDHVAAIHAQVGSDGQGGILIHSNIELISGTKIFASESPEEILKDIQSQ